MDLRNQIERRLELSGGSLPAEQVDKLAAYFGLMAKWNTTLNLTALQVEPASDEAIDRLIVEPVVAAALVDPKDILLVDLGSGGGSPGIPLKVSAPHLQLILVESKARKSA